jgi:hypothetical protein
MNATTKLVATSVIFLAFVSSAFAQGTGGAGGGGAGGNGGGNSGGQGTGMSTPNCGASGFFGHRFGVKRVFQTGVVDGEES